MNTVTTTNGFLVVNGAYYPKAAIRAEFNDAASTIRMTDITQQPARSSDIANGKLLFFCQAAAIQDPGQAPGTGFASYAAAKTYIQGLIPQIGGILNHSKVSLNTTNLSTVTAAATQLRGLLATNTHATAIAYLKLYNKASAPVLNTDVPVMVVAIPAAGGSPKLAIPENFGIMFPLGLAYAITGAAAVTDTTAVGANDVVVNMQYSL